MIAEPSPDNPAPDVHIVRLASGVLVAFHAGDDGRLVLRIERPDGSQLCGITENEDGCLCAGLHDQAGVQRGLVRLLPDGEPELILTGSAGEPRLLYRGGPSASVTIHPEQ